MYDPNQRYSTSSVNVSDISGHPGNYNHHHRMDGHDYNVMVDEDSAGAGNNNKSNSSKLLVQNDVSSSTLGLGITNQSLQGSLLSLNSGRQGSTISKSRNITQV